MIYNNFGEQDWKTSILGLGCMRLPVIDGDSENINEEKAIELIRYAIDNGINYVDTAWPYHGGNSEELVGKALSEGYREKVKLATKLYTPGVESIEDCEYYLDKQLERLQTDHIDLYLLHALNRKYWANYKSVNIIEWLEEKKEEGKINNIGFSFHDSYDLFEEIIDYYDWDFCQIQYNYLDTEFQAGKKGLKYAKDKGIAVVVMEPLRGGTLAQTPPLEVKNILDKSDNERNAVEWSLQWLWNQEEVDVVLSGMSNLRQLKENIELASKADQNRLNDNEMALIKKARRKFLDIFPVACTGCNYCIPCPVGVAIPNIFSLYNEAQIYDKYEANKKQYFNMNEDSRADNCIECGQCEEACPQNLNIIDDLKDVTAYFTE
ncbi:MAG: aldo/keto reductase [Halanaerobiales bacterium]|nr:aldo/keto reductase [Halanaerobiales bacterium]